MLKKLLNKIKTFLGMRCPYCGGEEFIEYGYYGYLRCKNCGKK